LEQERFAARSAHRICHINAAGSLEKVCEMFGAVLKIGVDDSDSVNTKFIGSA
jgi:hypothetical protein